MTVLQDVFLLPIKLYKRFISPLKPQPTCRFHPSCSSYALEAIEEHGAVYGSYLASKRILKCHPFHPGGFDPVPRPKTEQARQEISVNERLSEEF